MFNFIKEEDGGPSHIEYSDKELLLKKLYMNMLNNKIKKINYKKIYSIIESSLYAIKYIEKCEKYLDLEEKKYGHKMYKINYEENKRVAIYNLYGFFLGTIDGNYQHYLNIINKEDDCKDNNNYINEIKTLIKLHLKLRGKVIEYGIYKNINYYNDIESVMRHIPTIEKIDDLKDSNKVYDGFIKSYRLSYGVSSLIDINQLNILFNSITNYVDRFSFSSVNKMPKVKKIIRKF